MIDRIIELDTNLFVFLNNLGSPTWDSFWLLYAEIPTHLPFMLLLGFLLYKKVEKKEFFLILLFIAFMVTATDQLYRGSFFKFDQ